MAARLGWGARFYRGQAMRARLIGALWALLLAVLAGQGIGQAAAAGGLAIDPAASSITAEGRRGRPQTLTFDLALNEGPSWSAFLLGSPPRLVIDMTDRELAAGNPALLPGAALVPALRWGPLAEGRGRLVAELPGPMAIRAAQLTHAGAGWRLTLRLEPVEAAAFAPAGQGAALPQLWGLPQPAALPDFTARRPGPLRVTLDPGHGGIDPGATADGLTEAALMLQVAQEVAAALRAKGVEVTLTRDADRFLPLERRMTAARAVGADAFLSLHADALPAGEAAGAAVFTWASDASDRATRELAARHDRDDLLAGLDLAGTDDEVAGVLMEIARTDTGPRSQNLAQFLLSEMAIGRIAIRKRPVKGAGFSVLKSPDIPSVLIETGFLSDAQDRANLVDPAWRAKLAQAVAQAVTAWAEDDASRTPLLRR